MTDVVSYFKQQLKEEVDIELQKEVFWNLGKRIKDFSTSDLRLLHVLLLQEYGNHVIISIRNLQNMKKFYFYYSNHPTIIANYPTITWYMHMLILKHCSSLEDCLYMLDFAQKMNCTSCQLERLMNEQGWKKRLENDILLKERR